MIMWIVKKWVKGKLNDLLKEYKDNVEKSRQTVKNYIDRIESVSSVLLSIDKRLEDNKITDEELKDSLDDIERLIKSW